MFSVVVAAVVAVVVVVVVALVVSGGDGGGMPVLQLDFLRHVVDVRGSCTATIPENAVARKHSAEEKNSSIRATSDCNHQPTHSRECAYECIDSTCRCTCETQRACRSCRTGSAWWASAASRWLQVRTYL